MCISMRGNDMYMYVGVAHHLSVMQVMVMTLDIVFLCMQHKPTLKSLCLAACFVLSVHRFNR